MALKVGEKVPDFQLASTGGGTVSLGDLSGKAFVLYFYPKDFTSVCTKQACSFRDQFAELRDLAIPVFGVSRDSVETHLRFKKENNLPFELLADEEGEVARRFDARVPVLGMTKRITYLVDADQKIAAAHDDLFGDESHVKAMLEAVSP